MKSTLLPIGRTIKNGRGVIGNVPVTLVGVVGTSLALLFTGSRGLKLCGLCLNTMLSTLSRFEFVHFLIHSGTGINILFGVLAVVCYGLFSRFYEPLTRSTESPLLTASLLYGVAAIILLITAGICAFLFGWHFDPLSNIIVFGLHFDPLSSVRVFGLNFSITWVALILALLIIGMSLLYFSHIVTEAFARRGINMGIYTILFQINVLVIAIIDWAIYHTSFSIYVLLGGILIFLSSIAALIAHHFAPEDGNIAIKLDRLVVFLGVISAVFCGLALYIDGEVGRNYIFKGPFNTDAFPAFLMYEMLTFGIPFLWTFLVLSFSTGPLWSKYKHDNDHQRIFFVLFLIKVPLHVLHQLIAEFKRCPKSYFLSSLFSAGQFVFSVLALSLPGPRFYVAAALAISPIFSILLDRNEHRPLIKTVEYSCGILSAIGLFLLLIVSR